MAHTKSAKKRIRQTRIRTQNNRARKSRLRTELKKLSVAIASKDKPGAEKELSKSFSALDKAVKQGIIHRNKADRRKSRLAKRVAALP